MRLLQYGMLLLLAVYLPACVTVAEATRPATEQLGEMLLSAEDERQLGDELAAQVKQEMPVLQDQSVQQYVDRIGRQILDAVPDEQKRFDYEFTVLDTPQTVNAFALPGGHIFINSGLIRAADSEAELAAVVAHEVAHVVADHPSQQLAAQVGLQTVQRLVLGQEPGMIAQLGSAIAARGYLAAHTRDSEREADSLGLAYLAQAGYRPEAMASFFRELESKSGGERGFVQEFFATHPSPGDRVESARNQIEENDYGPGRDSIVGNFGQVRSNLGGPLTAS